MSSVPKIAMIVAVSENNVMGHQGRIPWHLPEDLRWFKTCTQGGILLMGRKTLESIGKVLSGRETWVLTTQSAWSFSGVKTFSSLEMALAMPRSQPLWICGGAEVYRSALPHCSELFLTRVHKNVDGDTYFPPFEAFFSTKEVLQKNSEFTVYRYY